MKKIAKTILLAVLAGGAEAGTLNEGLSAPGKLVLERPAASARPRPKKPAVSYGKWSVKFNGKKHKPEDFLQVCVWCGKTYCHKCAKTAQDAQCSSHGHTWYFVPAKNRKHKH